MNTVNKENPANPSAMFVLKCLLFSYVITGVLLFILAFALYKFGIGQNIVKAVIIITYVLSTFAAGFVAGKRTNNKRFLWGMFMGLIYFVVLAVMSLLVNRSVNALGDSFFSTMILCVGGGMLGGMMS